MLQRIQTIFMALAAVAAILFLFLPFTTAENKKDNITAQYSSAGMEVRDANGAVTFSKNTMLLSGVTLVSACVLIFTIFQFKNRQKQALFVFSTLILLLVTQGIHIYYYTVFMAGLPKEGTSTAFQFGFFLPMIALVFTLTALRFIRRDMNVVAESNRMR